MAPASLANSAARRSVLADGQSWIVILTKNRRNFRPQLTMRSKRFVGTCPTWRSSKLRHGMPFTRTFSRNCRQQERRWLNGRTACRSLWTCVLPSLIRGVNSCMCRLISANQKQHSSHMPISHSNSTTSLRNPMPIPTNLRPTKVQPRKSCVSMRC